MVQYGSSKFYLDRIMIDLIQLNLTTVIWI